VSAQNPALNLEFSGASVGAWPSRTLAVLLTLVIGTVFWVDSRYPALMKRYHAGTQVKAAGALTFGSVYQVDRATMPLRTRVWRTTVNWLDANRIGMTFSFLFGPAALMFLAMVPRRRTKSKYLNTLFGAVAGMPMAVCTNCVAPIARGFYAAGMSRESVLAAMFASPALNVVVLGALVIEALPAQTIVGQATIGGIVLVALVGAFLPVPMAFDVAIAYIAMTHGAPMPYVVAILCTLGIISVFSLSVLGKTISWRLAGAAYATVAALGVGAGLISRGW
jgi:hypothetical protein